LDGCCEEGEDSLVFGAVEVGFLGFDGGDLGGDGLELVLDLEGVVLGGGRRGGGRQDAFVVGGRWEECVGLIRGEWGLR